MNNLPTGFRDRLLTELQTLPAEEATQPAAVPRRRPLLLATAAALVLAATTGSLALATHPHPGTHRADAAVPAAFTVVKKDGIVTLTFHDVEVLHDDAARRWLEARLREEGVPAVVRDADGPWSSCQWAAPPAPTREQREAFLDGTSEDGLGVIRIDPSKIRPGRLYVLSATARQLPGGGLVVSIASYIATSQPVCVPSPLHNRTPSPRPS